MNPIVEIIERKKESFRSVRQTGRTTRLIEEVLDYATRGVGKKFIVFAQCQALVDEIMERTAGAFHSLSPIKIKDGNCLEVNGNVILFKTEYYKNSPGYKYQKWDGVFHDNSIYDHIVLENIRDLEKELKELF